MQNPSAKLERLEKSELEELKFTVLLGLCFLPFAIILTIEYVFLFFFWAKAQCALLHCIQFISYFGCAK